MKFGFLRRHSPASVARERLQLVLLHDRNPRSNSDLIAVLRDEILAVIAKHVRIDSDKVEVKMDRGLRVATLEIDVEISTSSPAASSDVRIRNHCTVTSCKSSR